MNIHTEVEANICFGLREKSKMGYYKVTYSNTL